MGRLKLTLCHLLCWFGPLLFGALLIVPPFNEPIFIMQWAKQAITFVVTFILFQALMSVALRLAPRLADLSRKNWPVLFAVIVLLIFNLVALEAFRRYFSESAFSMALGIQTLRALADILWSGVKLKRAYPQRAVIAEYLYWGLLGTLGAYCFLGNWNPILFVMAFALSGPTTAAIMLLRRTIQAETSSLIYRTFIVLAFSGPVIMSIFVYGMVLSTKYLATFVPALLIFKLPPTFFSENSVIPSRWHWQACFNSFLFAVIVLALNLT